MSLNTELVKGVLVALLASAALVHAADALRPEVSKPLLAAQNLLKAHKPREALAKAVEADAVPGQTAYEGFMIAQMQAAAAQQAGATAAAATAYTRLVESGRLPEAQQLQTIAALAGAEYQLQRYDQALQWANRYLKSRAGDAQMTTLAAQSAYLVGDCRALANAVQPGRVPEASLQLLANCYQKQGDNASYVSALERLVSYYPGKAYWPALLSRIAAKSGFARERLELDVYRLRREVGDFGTADDYMQMTQLALAGGYPGEAVRVINEGFARGALGTGDQAPRQQRLLALSKNRLSEAGKDGGAQDAKGADVFEQAFDAVLNGKPEGVSWMETNLSQVNSNRREDARLHLGIAYFLTGQKAKAIQTFKSVKGNDGTADIARLWAIRAQGA
ncbi:hypothetical protein PHO31112_02786 [Pandoraea horticolens]|uniref:Tetratricopeptide repeat protein n=1 Tax=Pandoraea horticolens TaxID=2508298 RepID=A0A5E4VT03_9BURK|nr:tetratricopeptide repeat protein [Pandoraea horticolens]VVE14210.1 hypothetical protein PHO31112_02786 [Pandoraea horticolens]